MVFTLQHKLLFKNNKQRVDETQEARSFYRIKCAQPRPHLGTKARSQAMGRGRGRRNGRGLQAVPPKTPPEAGGGRLPRKATFTVLGLGGHRMDTAVMTPRVPSDPMKSCFRS